MIVLQAGNLPTWQDDARRMHKLECHNTVKAPWGDRCIRSGGSITCPMPGTIRKPKSGALPCSISFSVSRPGPMPREITRAPGRGSLASRSRDAMDENGAIRWRVIAGTSRKTFSSKNPSGMSISLSVPGLECDAGVSSSHAHCASPPYFGAPPSHVGADGLFPEHPRDD